MGYLYLIIATIFGTTKGYCGKKVSGYVNETKDAILSNLIRMLLCCLVGVVLVVCSGGISAFNIGFGGFLISAFSGVASAFFVVSWLFAIKQGAYMLVDVFISVGLLVPIALCAIFFNEKIEWKHFLGFLTLIMAVVLLSSYNNSIKEKLTPKAALLLIMCSLSSGCSSFASKWFVKYSNGTLVSSFNLYTYIIASFVLFLCYLYFSKTRQREKSSFEIKPIFHLIVIMSVALFLNSYFLTLSASLLPAPILYPLNSGLSLILSAAMSSIFYKEKLTLKCITGILLAFISLIIINVL